MDGRVLKLREIGDPVLRQKSINVNITKNNKEIKSIIEDLKTTFEYNNGFGIAASQVGMNKSIIIIGVDINKCKYKNAVEFPITVMINPKITNYSKEIDEEHEGCLSIPVIRGKVKRSTMIEVEYYNEKFEFVKCKYDNFIARLIQHEFDHLNGELFIDKVEDTKSLTTITNLNKFNK
jgi:peptide deformylase